MARYDRVSVDPRQMGGTPCIRGLRIPVATVVGMVAEGMTGEEILAAYPDLEREDVARGPALCGRGCSRTGAAAQNRRLTPGRWRPG